MAPTATTIHAVAERAYTHEQPAIFNQRRLTTTLAHLDHPPHPIRGEHE